MRNLILSQFVMQFHVILKRFSDMFMRIIITQMLTDYSKSIIRNLSNMWLVIQTDWKKKILQR
jgi:hypothetical protein